MVIKRVKRQKPLKTETARIRDRFTQRWQCQSVPQPWVPASQFTDHPKKLGLISFSVSSGSTATETANERDEKGQSEDGMAPGEENKREFTRTNEQSVRRSAGVLAGL